MSGVRRVSVRLLIAVAFVVAAVAAQAQPQRQPAASSPPPASGPPNALQGFSQNRDQPVHIESTTLVVRDKEKIATFSGDVKVVQGDTTLKCKTLVVFYEQDSEAEAKASKTKTMQAAQPGPGGQQKIKRLEAHDDVVVLQKDQTATGELGTFDMKANTVALSGGVTMTQGQNVLRGDRLIVDLTTGVSRVESGKNGQGRVQGLFLPGSGAGPPDLKSGGAGLPAPAAPQAPRPGLPARPF
jgi:lipopolysaccharide export system protein LptA